MSFVYERAVRFEEVDAARIVFFARFLNYAHEAMEALLGGLDGGYVRLVNDRRDRLGCDRRRCAAARADENYDEPSHAGGL